MSRKHAARVWFGVAGLCVALACSRPPERIALTAPFNEETKVGEVTAVWTDTGERRGAGAHMEHKLHYRVDARNALQERLYVKLGRFRLVDGEGEAAADDAGVECALQPGLNEGVLAGSVWTSADRAPRIHGFQVERFAVPLSARGRALYREWLLQRRPGEAAAIDVRLSRYAAAPPCGGELDRRGTGH